MKPSTNGMSSLPIALVSRKVVIEPVPAGHDPDSQPVELGSLQLPVEFPLRVPVRLPLLLLLLSLLPSLPLPTVRVVSPLATVSSMMMRQTY